jgi:trimeric autotransporter adhesin
MAMGDSAVAKGDTAVAMGSNAAALGTNSIAVGDNAGAVGPGDVAVGQGAQVRADNSSAFGAGATVGAGHTNAAAFGAGAKTTRANQQMFGTASNTYTMAGLTSNASKRAQGAPTHLVTSNAKGDLAAQTPKELGLATAGDVSSLQGRDKQLTEGIAAVVALEQPVLHSGQNFAMRVGWGGYDDANAVGVSASGVLARNFVSQGHGTLTFDGGVGFGTDEGEVVGRGGLSFGW